ncbi:M23 family metallopeptidase [Sorangium sp. So ce887]|uniref:M23 family metallopeptidase n=1 Tax=Sorangium sp. So ce887 TaxID=3133324 RepID=UPI003F628D9D
MFQHDLNRRGSQRLAGFGVAALAASVAACAAQGSSQEQLPAEPESMAERFSNGSAIHPPTGVHWVRAGDRVRIVFSRSVDDGTDDRRVDHYQVCTDAGCFETAHNFLDVTDGTRAVIYSVDRAGTLSAPSERSELDRDWTVTLDAAEGLHPPDREMSARSAGAPPSTVYAPVFGALVQLGSSTISNRTAHEWSFWEHRSEHHKPRGGIEGADDTYAVDINLNITGAGSNLDKGAPFVAAGHGTVVDWAGAVAPGSGSTKAILVEHDGWWSGYLHASAVHVRAGDYVTPWTVLGTIGGSTGYPEHLHFAAYTGANTGAALKSYHVDYVMNHTVISLASSVDSLGVGGTTKLAATAEHVHSTGFRMAPLDLNDPSMYDRTWWKSSAPAVLSVDGHGNARGRAVGTATVSLWYSGAIATRTLTVR